MNNLHGLWAISISGPDDVIPAPTKAEAEAACLLLNAAFARMPTQGAAPMRATVAEWPYGAVDHAADAHLFCATLGSELQVAW